MLGEENLGLLQEPQDSQVRAVIAPAFTAKRVPAALPRIAALCEHYIDAWASAADVKAWDTQIKLFTLEVSKGDCNTSSDSFGLRTYIRVLPPPVANTLVSTLMILAQLH
jgi:hypothetical protein